MDLNAFFSKFSYTAPGSSPSASAGAAVSNASGGAAVKKRKRTESQPAGEQRLSSRSFSCSPPCVRPAAAASADGTAGDGVTWPVVVQALHKWHASRGAPAADKCGVAGVVAEAVAVRDRELEAKSA